MANTIKIENKNGVRVVAHRGLSGLEQENTNAAFIAAGNRSYYGIETDVHKTADGKFVIMHDGNTLRTGGEDIEINKVTYDVLQGIRLKEKNGNKNRADLRIPTLEEYISICKHYEKIAVLELKDEFHKEDVNAICEIIESMDYMKETVFISFHFGNLVFVKERNPEQAAQFLVEYIDDELIQKLADYHMGIDAYFNLYNEENVRKCHEKGIEVNAWTVDNPEDAKTLIEYGMDYITTNILE